MKTNVSIKLQEQSGRLKGNSYILVAFTATKAELSGIVANECDAFAGIARLRAKVTRLDSGDSLASESIYTFVHLQTSS